MTTRYVMFVLVGALTLGCPSRQETPSAESEPSNDDTEEPTKAAQAQPESPDAPPPGACAGQDPAPALACRATKEAVTCELTEPCVARLELKNRNAIEVRAWRWTGSGRRVGELKLASDGRSLSLPHKEAPGTPLFVYFSKNDVVSAATDTPYAQGAGGKALSGVRDGQVAGGGFRLSLHVPGGAELEPPRVVAGESIGPVKIGMTTSELNDLGLPTTPQVSQSSKVLGSYDVGLQDGRVTWVAYELSYARAGLSFGEAAIPTTAELEEAARPFPNCGEVEHLTGGSTISCDGGKVNVNQDITGGITIQVMPESTDDP